MIYKTQNTYFLKGLPKAKHKLFKFFIHIQGESTLL